jgi:integrase
MAQTRGIGHVFTRTTSSGENRWYAQYTGIHGKRVRSVLPGITTKTGAQKELAKFIALREDQAIYGVRAKSAAGTPIALVMEKYLIHAELHLKPLTYRLLKADLERTLADLRAPTVIGELTTDNLRRLQVKLKRDGQAHRTINKKANAIKTMLKWGVTEGIIDKNPMEALKALDKLAVRPRRAFPDADLIAFLQAAQEYDTEASPKVRSRVFLFLLGLVETGCRYGELRQLTWNNIDLAEGVIRLPGKITKNGEARWVPVSSLLKVHLENTKFKSGPLFPRETTDGSKRTQWLEDASAIGDAFRKLLVNAGIPRVNTEGEYLTVHSLRHTFCTRLVRSGMPLTHIQKLTGHKTLQVLLDIYTHLDMDDVRSSYVNLVPPLRLETSPTTATQEDALHAPSLSSESAQA